MKKIIPMLFVGTLILITIQSVATAVDCDGCEDLYWAARDAGYSREEAAEAIAEVYDCDECPNLAWLYGSSKDSDSSSDSGGDCCGATAAIILPLCGVFIVYYGKKREMKR